MGDFVKIYVKKTVPKNPELIQAVEENNVKMVAELLKKNPNTGMMTTEKGIPILYVAIENRSADIVRILLENGANPDERGNYDDDSSPLHLAIRLGHYEITNLLLEYGADVNRASVWEERTPIELAIKSENPRLVALLCRFDAVIKAKDKSESKPISTILDTCRKSSAIRTGSFHKIVRHFQKVLRDYGTVYIQSQKTGQCYSDAFQFILYYADGLNQFFIENAVKQDMLPEREKKRIFPKNGMNVEKYMKKGNDLVDLYMAFTGNRFLNMVQSNPMQIVGPAKTLKRRKSVIDKTVFNTGVVCSTIIHIYDLFQKAIPSYGHIGIDRDEKGNLTEDSELMFWSSLLRKVPSKYGSGGIYTPDTLVEDQEQYIIGILFVLYPSDYRENVGHEIAIVKIFGKWYLCDDNIGFAQPIEFTIEELKTKNVSYEMKAGTISYMLYNTEGERELFSYQFKDPLFNYSDAYGDMGEVDEGRSVATPRGKTISRKYITWDPKGRAATTKYDYKVIPPPERKLVTWKEGNVEVTEYQNVLNYQDFLEKEKLRRIMEMDDGGFRNSVSVGGARTKTRRIHRTRKN